MQPPARSVAMLLNIAHGIDHLFLLIFATAVGAIASDFGLARWEDLMPYGVGAFLMFGLGSLPAGKLGDSWGRRPMMLVFFFGMGASALLAAATQNAWQLAAALSLLGAFSAIYHPVGIPMLVQGAAKPGASAGTSRANSTPSAMHSSPGTTKAARQPARCTRKPVAIAAPAMPRLPLSPLTPMVQPGRTALRTSIGMPTGW